MLRINCHIYPNNLKHLFTTHQYPCIQIANKSTRLLRYSTSSDGKDKNKSPEKVWVKWLYAADIPKRKPSWVSYKQEKEPSKFISFSEDDSRRLEHAYLDKSKSKSKVKVNEDKLFEVNLDEFEMYPVYWEGPVYEVRRGVWFNLNGIPLGSKETAILEQGYQQIKPYKFKNRSSTKKTDSDISAFRTFVFDENSKKMSHLIDVDEEEDIIQLDEKRMVLFFDEMNAAIIPASINMKFQINAIRNFGPNSISLMSIEYIKRGFSRNLEKSDIGEDLSQSVSDISNSWKQDLVSFFSTKNEGEEGDSVASKKADYKGERENVKMENSMRHDFDQESKSDREIDHLLLCVHGIGQILGQKYESINFTHSINVLRNTMNTVYESDEVYKNLAHRSTDKDDSSSGNKVQVLPISWRHKLDFQPHKPFELFDEEGKHRLPSLSQINVDGVKSLRNILGDVVLDVLLFYESKYRYQLVDVVTEELNRVYKLYKENNPNFKGKVHLMGHSLGSAITFEILCRQKNKASGNEDNQLVFDVENVFCVGSPVGVFKLLEQKNIKARSIVDEDIDNSDSSVSYSSPKCKNLYNIFHPCDPVGYRMEPLISPEYSNFKPEAIPFARKGINTQIKELSVLGDEISEKIASASKWLKKSELVSEAMSIDEKANRENALGDIITSLATDRGKDDKNKMHKIVHSSELDTSKLSSINRSGRVDYSLPIGVFDFSLISAVSAHVSYFEDEDTAGFIMREMLSSHLESVKDKKISLYK